MAYGCGSVAPVDHPGFPIPNMNRMDDLTSPVGPPPLASGGELRDLRSVRREVIHGTRSVLSWSKNGIADAKGVTLSDSRLLI